MHVKSTEHGRSNRDGTGVHDSIVNQLLSKIDGVEALNNILLIGMTSARFGVDVMRPVRAEPLGPVRGEPLPLKREAR